MQEIGKIVIELDREKAPSTVDNFIGYCRDHFYIGTIFHRVIKGKRVHGGRYVPGMIPKNVKLPLHNESDNGLKNLRGTIAMARERQPHSATSEFFINTADNPNYDFEDKTFFGWGYCVFGKVVKGMDIIDEIEQLPTDFHGIHHADVPVKNYVIDKIQVMRNRVTFNIVLEE